MNNNEINLTIPSEVVRLINDIGIGRCLVSRTPKDSELYIEMKASEEGLEVYYFSYGKLDRGLWYDKEGEHLCTVYVDDKGKFYYQYPFEHLMYEGEDGHTYMKNESDDGNVKFIKIY